MGEWLCISFIHGQYIPLCVDFYRPVRGGWCGMGDHQAGTFIRISIQYIIAEGPWVIMKVFSIKKETILLALYLLLIFPCLISVALYKRHLPASTRTDKKTIIVDPGHGGEDPGVIVSKLKEKTINLKIGLKLKEYLEQSGFTVIMTREDDEDLASNKQADMYRRKLIANDSGADIFISIHQNYNSNSKAQGAQVYYYKKSELSKLLAESIQAQIKNIANPSNRMKSQSNTDYFVLRQTTMPAVIVECGFMSNPGERWKLTTADYQEKIAWAIYMGTIKYFESDPSGKSPQ